MHVSAFYASSVQLGTDLWLHCISTRELALTKRTRNLVPRARVPLGRGTKGSGIIHLILASDWLGRNVAI